MRFRCRYILHNPIIHSTIIKGVMTSKVLMYSRMGVPEMLSWLLAAAMVVQPVSGFSCGCGGAGTDSGTRSARHGCCCCCSGAGQRCGCCGGSAQHRKVVSKPQGSCCQHRADRDSAPTGVSTCKCGSGAPAAPQSVPAERSNTDDLAVSMLCACVATVDVSAIRQDGRAGNLPTEFASASEHCIALCRLLI